jgi:hypothetical protein
MIRAAWLAMTLVLAASETARGADRPVDGKPAPLATAIELAAKDAASMTPAWAVDRPQRRPATLPILYGSYAGLQILDIVSTKKALSAGASEANPLLKSGGNARTIAIKAGTGAATIVFAERAWKKNKAGAIVLMAALNGATAAIVARNAHHASRP